MPQKGQVPIVLNNKNVSNDHWIERLKEVLANIGESLEYR